MERVIRALTLATLLGATVASARTSTTAQRVHFTGPEAAFAVVATATAHVTIEPPVLRVTLEQGTIRATRLAATSQHITGYRINLGYAKPSGEWDMR